MTAATFDNVTKVMNAAQKDTIGVWLIGKSLKIIPMAQEKRVNAMMIDNYREFVGCYNNKATAAMVKQDLS